MRSSIKGLSDVNSLADIRSYTSAGVRKSAKPALPTTHILDLYMRRNEKERLEKELKKLKKRKELLMKRLESVDKEMDKLLTKATNTAYELRGETGDQGDKSSKSNPGNTVLEY